MADETPSEPGAVPAGPSPDAMRFARALGLTLLMIPVGGLVLMISGNAFLYGWLEIVPKMSYGQACGGMALLWLVRFFMYR